MKYANILIYFRSSIAYCLFIKESWRLNFFLGIEAQRTSTALILSQKKYIIDILIYAKMANPISSPAEPGSQLLSIGDPMDDPTLYRSIFSALQYAIITHPGIS